MNKNNRINPNHTDSDDIKAITRVIEGDVNAFEYLLKKYKHHVIKIVHKHLPYDQVEETAHDVFIRAYRSLPTFKGKGSFKQWLSGIAVRTCYDFFRKKYRTREIPMSAFSDRHQKVLGNIMSDQSCVDYTEKSNQKEIRELLDQALDKLTPEDRMVMELVYFEGFSGKEAAELLGLSVANVKIRSFRSRKKLRKLLAGLGYV